MKQMFFDLLNVIPGVSVSPSSLSYIYNVLMSQGTNSWRDAVAHFSGQISFSGTTAE